MNAPVAWYWDSRNEHMRARFGSHGERGRRPTYLSSAGGPTESARHSTTRLVDGEICEPLSWFALFGRRRYSDHELAMSFFGDVSAILPASPVCGVGRVQSSVQPCQQQRRDAQACWPDWRRTREKARRERVLGRGSREASSRGNCSGKKKHGGSTPVGQCMWVNLGVRGG